MADLSPQLWIDAKIIAIRDESPTTKTFRLSIDKPYPFIAGQHCSIQIKTDHSPDAREYSFSSSPSSRLVEFTVAKIPNGALSNWFIKVAHIGEVVQISPAVGSNFTWTPKQLEPILLIGGGIGIAPLMCIWREHRAAKSSSQMNIVYSCREHENVCFKNELIATPSENIHLSLTGATGRIEQNLLAPLIKKGQTIYVSGSNNFVKGITEILATLSVPESSIRRELFS